LLKAGLAAVPVVLTLRSRPVWGAEGPAPKPSGGVESGFYVSSGGTNPDPGSLQEEDLDTLEHGLTPEGYYDPREQPNRSWYYWRQQPGVENSSDAEI